MIFDKIILEELINPHYAFPIAGVFLLCALLVFFGFKSSPVPPSFNFDDSVQKSKSTSKKKNKNKEKVKQVQNGAVQHQTPILAGDSTGKSDNKLASSKSKEVKEKGNSQPVTKVSPSKALPAKTQTPKGQPAKSEGKSKSKKTLLATTNQQQLESNGVPDIKSDESSLGGEWAQILSRKDRKNRKKDDVVGGEIEKLRNVDNITSNNKKKKKSSSKDVLPSPTPKEVVPKSTTDEIVPSSTAKEILPKEELVEEKVTPVVVQVIVEPKAEPKKKSAKKVEKQEISMSDHNEKKSKEAAKSSEIIANETSALDKSSKVTKGQKSRPIADEKMETSKEDETLANEEKKNPDTTNVESSNVIFDELRDIWQEAKPLKKKKKVRRE